MRRETQNLLLVLVGIAVLRIVFDDTYLRYVKAGLFPFLLISGLAVLALATAAIVRDVYRGGPGHGHDDAHAHGSGKVHWVLLVPAAALLLVTPPALGADAAVTSAPLRPRSLSAETESRVRPFPPLPDGPAPFVTITDLVNRANFDALGSLDGREVTVSGFVLYGRDGGLDLARVVISCCVADARYVRVHLAGVPEPLAEDTWLEVRGVVETGSARSDPELAPTLVVHGHRRIERPENSYEQVR
ncbi:TIGR03943 family putative permease subunit [Nocardia farcinica]|uniref:TIGR03943 family putative permease subunit n=1 Tax=Nocardia farcinica TaxID=37329 RepID=UPI00189436BE|nr:TIGR03943 family protein [Nocardia farcinica]MBF6383004.1 TIGR03943 family protein [Nocardia farcinica]